MGRALGSDAQTLLAKEVSYGVTPAVNFTKMPFISNGLDTEQGLINDPVLGRGREPQAPQQDVINDDGSISVPVDVRYIGHWLTGLLGAPDSSDETTHWEHVFVSGKDALPSYSIEVGHPKVPSFVMHPGVLVDAMEFSFERSGFATCTVDLIGQGAEDPEATTGGGTPVTQTYKPFSQFQGSIKKDGVVLGNVERGSLRYSNNLDRVEVIRDDGKIAGADPTVVTVSGNIVTRFDSLTFLNAATNGTPMELEFAYTIDANQKLVLTAHQVHLPKPKIPIDGPGGVRAPFTFQGALDEAEGVSLTATLLNDIDDTVY